MPSIRQQFALAQGIRLLINQANDEFARIVGVHLLELDYQKLNVDDLERIYRELPPSIHDFGNKVIALLDTQRSELGSVNQPEVDSNINNFRSMTAAIGTRFAAQSRGCLQQNEQLDRSG